VKILHYAEAHGLGAAIHCGGSIGPVLAASWHLAAASITVEWLEHVMALGSVQREFLVDNFEIKDGSRSRLVLRKYFGLS